MSEVRFQPKSAPRSTSIARTVMSAHKPSGAGVGISSSAAATPAARAFAQGNQHRNIGGAPARSNAPAPNGVSGAGSVAGVDFTSDELRFLGHVASRAIGEISDLARSPNATPEQGQKTAEAYATATKALDKIGAELQRRGV